MLSSRTYLHVFILDHAILFVFKPGKGDAREIEIASIGFDSYVKETRPTAKKSLVCMQSEQIIQHILCPAYLRILPPEPTAKNANASMSMRATLRHVLTSPPPPPSGAGISVPSAFPGDDTGTSADGAAGSGNVLASPTASTLGPAPQGTSLYTSSSVSTSPSSPHVAAAGSIAGSASGGSVSAGAAAAGGTAAAAAPGDGPGGSRPRLLCVHPTLPLCAYVLTNPTATGGGKVDGGSGTSRSIAKLMRGAPPGAAASTLLRPRLHLPGSGRGDDDATTDTKEDKEETAPTSSTAIWDGRDDRIVVQDYARDSIVKVWNVADVAAWINAEECRRDLVTELEEEAALAASDTDGDDEKKKKDEQATNAGIGKTVMLGTIRSISFWDRHVGQYTCADGLCDPGLVGSAASADGSRRDGSGAARRERFRLPRGTSTDANDGAFGAVAAVSNQYRSGIRTNSALSSCGMMPQSLAVQFDTRAVLLNLKGPGRNPPAGIACAAGGGGDAASVLAAATATIPSGGFGGASSSSASASPWLTIPVVDPYGPLTALITPEDLVGNVPTSPAVPITASVLAIGCSDGTVRFYDMDRRDSGRSGGSSNKKNAPTPAGGSGTVIKSVRGPNGRNDPVVRVVNVNSDALSDANSGSAGGDTAARILTVCASGVAYLWNIFVSASPATEGSGGSSVRLKINPPVCRLDGLGENRRAEIKPTTDFYGGRAQCSLVTATRISYDAQNDVVSWCVPNYAGVSRYHTVTWDLRRMPQAAAGVVAPRLPPRTVVVLPTSLSVPGEDDESKTTDGPAGGNTVDAETPRTGDGPDAVGTGPIATHSSGSPSSIIDIVPNLSHPSLPCDGSVVACLLVTVKGDVATVASSLAGKTESANNTAVPFHRTSLSALLSTPLASSSPAVISPKNSAGVTAAALADVRGGVRVYAVAVPELLPTICLLATSGGVTVVDLSGSTAQGIGSRHVLLAPGTIAPATDPTAAQNNSGRQQRNPGILLVTQGTVYAATLNCPPTHSKNVFFMGPIRTVNTTPVYNLASSIRSQITASQGIDGPSRLPPNALKSLPRLLQSPSGNYVCLYWHAENRYKILHIGTLIKTARSSSDARQMSTERQTSALVDAGTNVLSFAWVGDDEDVFSLLHPPSGGDDDADGLVSPQATSRNKGGGKRGMSKLKSKLASGAGGDDAEDEEFDPTAAGTIPRIELKNLVGVTAGATEISGSVAAATATTLGDLVLRGGGRHPPTALFGGPVLCVASLSYDREGRPDGMAYLYARKEGTEASDMRAASYSTVGTSLPYPDLAVWDDAGRTCAMVTGDRIAVYQVQNSSFSLVGTAPVLSAVRSDQGSIVVESLKFIQGVLYVTTQNSLQVVFLCEKEDTESRGTLDSYLLAGPDVPTTSASAASQQSMSKSFRPTPIPMALNHPSILSYHGSYLLLSTASGVRAVPLSHPLIRIGILIAAGQTEAASRWFDTVPRRHHEKLASFLERRGAPDLAVTLPGLSLESTIDICIRYTFTDRIKEIVDNHSVDLRSIDGGGRGKGASSSILVGMALNLFANGQIDTVTRIASDLIALGEEARSEGLLLAGLLVSAGAKNADVLLDRAIDTTTREGGGGDIPAAVLRA